jgi:hypothetical protein
MKTTNGNGAARAAVGIAAALEEIRRQNMTANFDYKAFAAAKMSEKSTGKLSLAFSDYLRSVKIAAVACGLFLAASVSAQAGDGFGSIAERWNQSGPGSIESRWNPNLYGSIEHRWLAVSSETDATRLVHYQAGISDATAPRVIDASAGLKGSK